MRVPDNRRHQLKIAIKIVAVRATESVGVEFQSGQMSF
jgi:hypothetical protein